MFKCRLSALALAGAFVLVVPGALAGTIHEDFSTNPAARGWRVAGRAELYHWNAANQSLDVTWDSSQPNSFFYRPLGTVLNRSDDFSLGFDLRLSDAGIGAHTNKVFPLQVAVGFLNLAEATRTNFVRGSGTESPDLVEFDYFWDAGFGATVWPECVSSNSGFNFNGPSDYLVLALTTNDWYRAVMTFTASNHTLLTTLTNLATLQGRVIISPLITNFTDFRLDAIAVSSYTDAGDPYDSILAHGALDNLVVTVPAPPVTTLAGALSNGVWQARVESRSNWFYSLERTLNFQTWVPASTTNAGDGSVLEWTDTNCPPGNAYYRVRAQKP